MTKKRSAAWLLTGTLAAGFVPACSPLGSEQTGEENIASLTGSWDVMASQGSNGGGPITGTLAWSEDDITIDLDGRRITLNIEGEIGTGRHSTERDQVFIQRRGVLDLGVIPFNLGESWDIGDDLYPDKRCRATLAPSSITAICGNRTGSGSSGDLNFSASRTRSKTSIFGKMGGTWKYDYNNSCVVEIENSRIDVVCTKRLGGTEKVLSLEVADDIISGNVLGDVEFSARRRK